MKGNNSLFSYNCKSDSNTNYDLSSVNSKEVRHGIKFDLQFFASKSYKTSRGEKLLKKVNNKKLRNFISQVFRKNADVGDGGLADAIKEQIKTGKLVKGKDHIQKGKERLTNLDRIINKETLSKEELKISKKLYKEIEDALKGVK